ncbi:MAG: hypothetical protein WCW30_02920, partial [Candidatus Gracilibacteria bacterium]
MMFKAFIAFLMASALHAGPMDAAKLTYEPHWQTSPLLKVEPLPQQNEDVQPLNLSAESVIAVDLNSAKILYEKNSSLQRPIASLTKIMTGLIIAEEENPYSVVQISENAAGTEGSIVWLNAGEEMTVKDLMYGLLIASGNDAAVALAEYNAGSTENFIKKMNQKAIFLGLTNTHYSNPVGMDTTDNYSTAQDLALLSMYALQNDFFMEPVSLEKYEVESESGITHEYISTNKLLSEDIGLNDVEISGLKTGTTPEAGECLITLATYNNDQQILTVVLGSADRFNDTENLLRWIDTNYTFTHGATAEGALPRPASHPPILHTNPSPMLPFTDTVRHLSLLFVSFSLSFGFALIMARPFISLLKKWKVGKQIREVATDGKAATLFHAMHKKKTGIPTMGGILIWGISLFVILLSRLLSYLGWFDHSLINRKETYLPIFTLLMVALLGALDDWLNIRGFGKSKGLAVKPKFLWLTLFATLGALWFYFKLGYNQIHIPGVNDFVIGWWYIPLFIFIIIASANAVNITDGLDGLAGGLSIIAYASFTAIAYAQGLFILAAFCMVIC